MKKILIALVALFACVAVDATAAIQAKKVIKQMKKSVGVTVVYGMADGDYLRTRLSVCGDKQRV